jgi:chromosome segregation ATPase
MTDDLVKRLREADPEGLPCGTEQMCAEAADRIEFLERELAEANRQIKELENELDNIEYEMCELENRDD